MVQLAQAAKAADAYVDRCVTAARPNRPKVWTFLESALLVGDDFSVTIRRRFGLNPRTLPPWAADAGRVQLIPCPFTPAKGEVTGIEIASLGRNRLAMPVSYYSLKELSTATDDEMAVVEEFTCVALDKGECSTAPTVAISARNIGSQRLGEVSLRRFEPLSEISGRFEDEELPSSLSLSLPEYAEADVIAVRVTLILRANAEDIRRAALDLPDATGDDKQARAANALSEQAIKSVLLLGTKICDVLKGAIATTETQLATCGIEGDEAKKVATSWLGRLSKAKTQFDAWFVGVSASTPAMARASMEGLAQFLDEQGQIEFICPFRLDSALSVDLDPLRLVGPEDLVDVRCLQVVAPFTTDREPGSQGKASSLLLLILALVMLLCSLVDVSWLPWASFVPEFLRRPVPSVEAVRGPLISVLLIFPAVLYGQFFQSRPRSPAGIKAQLSTFALLSLTFVLPVLPATVLAKGGSLSAASMWLFLGALVAACAGVYSLWILSSGALVKSRRRAIFEVKVGETSS